jgi:hypothetical protein
MNCSKNWSIPDNGERLKFITAEVATTVAETVKELSTLS